MDKSKTIDQMIEEGNEFDKDLIAETYRLLNKIRLRNPQLLISEEVMLMAASQEAMELRVKNQELTKELKEYKNDFGYCQCGQPNLQSQLVADEMCVPCQHDRNLEKNGFPEDHEDFVDELEGDYEDDLPF